MHINQKEKVYWNNHHITVMHGYVYEYKRTSDHMYA